MHARAVIRENRLGHEGYRLAGFGRRVLDDVLVLHHVVGRIQQRVEAQVGFRLAARGPCVVLALDVHPDSDHVEDHLRTQVLIVIGGGNREVAFLIARAIAKVLVIDFIRPARVPTSLVGINVIKGMLRRTVKSDAVKNKELGFRPKVSCIGNSGGFQVRISALHDVARIAMIGFLRWRIGGVPNHDESRDAKKRVHECRIRIGNQEHVRFVDGSPPANRTGVESESFLEGALLELADGVADMLPEAGNIDEAKVEDLRAMLFRKFQYTFCVHSLSLWGSYSINEPHTKPWVGSANLPERWKGSQVF